MLMDLLPKYTRDNYWIRRNYHARRALSEGGPSEYGRKRFIACIYHSKYPLKGYVSEHPLKGYHDANGRLIK